MTPEKFLDILTDLGSDFYTGVPDSLLNPFINAVVSKYGLENRHIIAPNEGAAAGLAAGHYLATGRPAVVYMQNSGLGNALNPICSLLHKDVFAIPVIFIIGWRGEPGIKDEPQHVFQGKITLPLLDCLEIPYCVAGEDDLILAAEKFKEYIKKEQSVAFVIRKNTFVSNEKTSDEKINQTLKYPLSREEALEIILKNSCGVYVCTTGKLSREVYEIRKKQGENHQTDFLTVGSMGHNIMIAWGIASEKPEKRVFCLDGDGSALMHLGSLVTVGNNAPDNLVHVVINNSVHESVGGLPVSAPKLNLSEVARISGYKTVFCVSNKEELIHALKSGADNSLFIEIMCNLNSRPDLGRPFQSPTQNKNNFMSFLKREKFSQ